ncbi:MAG: hypothetical protein HZA50_10295 [Planctomycetes bacterium]|nr:hypothetical protein [Planctomycetota bacterium]
MYIRPCHRVKNGKRHAYWALVESLRTHRGPRQRVVAYLGQMDGQGRLAVARTAEGVTEVQRRLDEEGPPQWVTADARRVRVERCLEFGGPWLACGRSRKVAGEKNTRPCLSRRIDNIDNLRREVKAWEAARYKAENKVDWQFTTEDARIKLKRLYPSIYG